MPHQRITHEDVASMVEARRELGEEMELAAAESGGVAGIITAWVGIVGVSFAFSRRG
jgi:hypothetical protein